MLVKEIDFATIEHIWRTQLWPGRVSAIEPFSTMRFMDDKYDMSFADRQQVFLGGFFEEDRFNNLVAVNSLHLAESYMARSRGLWLAPKLRGMGLGKQMLVATNDRARELGAEAIWSFSRKSSIRTYEDAGYIRTSSWMDHGEFGPNAYVIAHLDK